MTEIKPETLAIIERMDTQRTERLAAREHCLATGEGTYEAKKDAAYFLFKQAEQNYAIYDTDEAWAQLQQAEKAYYKFIIAENSR